MKTEPNFPHQDHNTAALIRALIAASIALAILLAFTGCTLSVSPDGARHWSIDGEQAARAIIIYTK
jgi:hypothetical protein